MNYCKLIEINKHIIGLALSSMNIKHSDGAYRIHEINYKQLVFTGISLLAYYSFDKTNLVYIHVLLLLPIQQRIPGIYL